MEKQKKNISMTLEPGKFRSFGLSYTLVTFFSMLIQATVSTYFANYMTDTVLIPAGTASVIMLVACIWDAVNDPMMGALADRTNTKIGRYRPYLLISTPILMLVSFFLFRNPEGAPLNFRIAYIAIFYILYGMVITMYTIPQSALVPAYIGDMKQRTKAYMLSGIAAGVGFTVASSFSDKIAGIFGGGTWSWNMILYGVPLMLTGFWMFKETKEIHLTKRQTKTSLMKDLKIVLKYKPVWVCLLIFLMASLGYGMMFSSSVYYIKYCVATSFEQWALIGTYMLVLSLGALVSMVVLQPIILKISKYYAYKAMIISQIPTFILYVVLFFAGRSNFVLLCVLSFIATCFTAMEQALVSPFIADAIDFIKLKEGETMNGTISALKGFAYKCGTTLVNYGILAILAVTGYVENAVGVQMGQSAAAVEAINVMRFGVPALTCVVLVLCCVFYPIKKYYTEIESMKASE